MCSIFILLFLSATIPIYSLSMWSIVNSTIYINLLSEIPRYCILSIVVVGFLFIILTASHLFLLFKTTFFEKRIAYILTLFCASLLLGMIGIMGGFLNSVNPHSCDYMELKLIYGIFSNETFDLLDMWKMDNRCIIPSDCIVPAHNYIYKMCRLPFSVYLIFECLCVAFLVIFLICNCIIQCALDLKDENELEDTQNESQSDNIQIDNPNIS
ncbi:hypothetical protein TRFO_31293 [Tritrichomonas foetus]|uniref:Uncharacterized protein n=1 Tax=Tritrichomonas foetus TaxID=1144522 RepID=A0A1J4JW41_9EUKA|nr:hypothetical protein TRFO_31293 [Tritrichomonas foetus]|eukprot:OHT01740.1 hypothetical protein TRFO_31293 [Tritrichomonas foetus]